MNAGFDILRALCRTHFVSVPMRFTSGARVCFHALGSRRGATSLRPAGQEQPLRFVVGIRRGIFNCVYQFRRVGQCCGAIPPAQQGPHGSGRRGRHCTVRAPSRGLVGQDPSERPRSVDNGPPADSLLERESDSSPWIPNQCAARSHERDLGILTCTVRPSRTMACMRKIEKPSPTESPLLFEFDPKPAEEVLTALGGLPLVVQAFRSLGLPGSVKQHVAVRERQRGYDEATFVESCVILNAAGGECLDDFERLRADPGLGELLGHEVPSPEAARKFLYAFHEEEKIQQAKQQRQPDQIAYIPSESEPLEGLRKVNQDLIRRLGERCPEQKIATVDQDTTIIESRKQEALHTYEGPRGYQPMLAVWAEMDAVLADEFRDGNVPAQMAALTVAKAAFAALPKTVTSYYYRGDSACHERELLRWLSNEKRAEGPQGCIC